MSLQVSFRVVGIYCYFENLVLETVSPSSTVKEVMDAIAAVRPAFSYGGGDEVSTMSYTFGPESTQPYNTLTRPSNGYREESELMGPGGGTVWQYYRSVTGAINGTNCEIKTISKGQPKFAATALNKDLNVPSGFDIATYNLTWRLVRIQMTPEAVSKRLANAQVAVNRKVGR